MSENDCTFKIPPHICKKLGIDDEEDAFKEYMVKDNGELYLPWLSMFRFNGWMHDGSYDGIMTEAGHIIESIDEDSRKKGKKMISILIDYHESKFDRQKGVA